MFETTSRSTHVFESFDRTKIEYRMWGQPTERTTVVCCSGIACDDVYWTFLAPELGHDRLVITWDYPFHGSSGPPGDPSEIRVESLARHAGCVMEKAGVERAAIIGHSMGVQVAFEVLRSYRDRVAALIPIAGPFANTVGSLYGTNMGVGLLKLLEKLAEINPSVADVVWRLSTTPAVADPVGRFAGLIGHAPVDLMARYLTHLGHFDPGSLFAMFRAGHEHSAEDLLGDIDVPVLILHGTADVMSPIWQAQTMAERVPGAELVAVQGGAHTLPIEDPGFINDQIRRFLVSRVDA
ncbi:MAG: alpha/beta fold hydrolase [Actinomycetota bacterium]|nr:alpha/beta hydrolase [Actinomycetota bacterium]